MDNTHNSFPLPSNMGVMLFIAFWFFNIMGQSTHTELNLWIATIVGLGSLAKYGYEFYKFILKHKKNRK